MSNKRKKEEIEISRREFLKDATLVAGSAALGSVATLATASAQTASAQGAAAPVTLEVYDPTGAMNIDHLFSPRLADLNNKTICEVGDAIWQDDRTFPYLRNLLKKQFPTINIIPYTEFPWGSANIDVANIGKLLKAKGCDGAILGNAG